MRKGVPFLYGYFIFRNADFYFTIKENAPTFAKQKLERFFIFIKKCILYFVIGLILNFYILYFTIFHFTFFTSCRPCRRPLADGYDLLLP
jgi:hypothetical protein